MSKMQRNAQDEERRAGVQEEVNKVEESSIEVHKYIRDNQVERGRDSQFNSSLDRIVPKGDDQKYLRRAKRKSVTKRIKAMKI